jgi:D-serine dehydratase
MLEWVRRAWREAKLRLEPSAASGFAAVTLFIEAERNAGAAVRLAASDLAASAVTASTLPSTAIHVVWTTGGSQLPDDQFAALLEDPSRPAH